MSTALDAAPNSDGCQRLAEQGDRHYLLGRGSAFLVPAPAALAMAEGREGSWLRYLLHRLDWLVMGGLHPVVLFLKLICSAPYKNK